MSDYSETLVSLNTKFLQYFPQLLNGFPISLSNLIPDGVSRHNFSSGSEKELGILDTLSYNLFFNPRRKMDCLLGTFGYFRPLIFVVVNPRIDSHYFFFQKKIVRVNHITK